MRRILLILLSIVLILAAIAFVIVQGGEIATTYTTRSQNLVSLILALLQVIGIFLAIILSGFILSQYLQYIRPHRFIFDGFSNEGELTNADTKKMPVNLSKLAREELVDQFKIIYRELKKYTQETRGEPEDIGLDNDDLYYFGKNALGKNASLPDISLYLPAPTRTTLGYGRVKKFLDDLEALLNTFGDSEMLDLAKSIGTVAPKETAQIINFIEAILPPSIIKAVGYLQWKGEVGITFEIIDVQNEASTMIDTIWQLPAYPSEGSLKERYIKLLEPAMRWLVLVFWEWKVQSHLSRKAHFLFFKKSARSLNRANAVLYYLIGALYYASADEFPSYEPFFSKLAVEHFRLAAKTDQRWYLPVLYLANIYRFKMKDAKGEMRGTLFDKALRLYDRASQCADREGDHCASQRINFNKALAQADSGIDDQENSARQMIEDLIKELEGEPTTELSLKQVDCASYLYNLAVWCANASKREQACRALAYCLALSPSWWDRVERASAFVDMREDLKFLKEKLNKQPSLVKLSKKKYVKEINMILDNLKSIVEN